MTCTILLWLLDSLYLLSYGSESRKRCLLRLLLFCLSGGWKLFCLVEGFAWRGLGIGGNYAEDNYNTTEQTFVVKDFVIFTWRIAFRGSWWFQTSGRFLKDYLVPLYEWTIWIGMMWVGWGYRWGVADVGRVVSIDGVCGVRHIFWNGV